MSGRIDQGCHIIPYAHSFKEISFRISYKIINLLVNPIYNIHNTPYSHIQATKSDTYNRRLIELRPSNKIHLKKASFTLSFLEQIF